MAVRRIYLRIEAIPDYSPVDPDPHVTPPRQYRRDCMRNMGHEDTVIPDDEVNARRLTALIYREYLDPGYLVPRPDKLILADINEPSYHRRVPGAVIYSRPGDRLVIRVKNADREPHSFHVHGLRYGIESDGSWPLGVQAADGRRSDEICPGQHWEYTFDVTDKMVGAWPFHDHYRDIGAVVNRGLFGGIVVLPREGHRPPPCFPLPRLLADLVGCCHHCDGHGGDCCHHDHGHDHGDHDHHHGGHHHDHGGRPHPHPPVGRIARPGHLPPPRGGGGHGHGHGHGGGSDATEPEPAPPEVEGALAGLEEMAEAPHRHPKVHPHDVLHVPIFLHQMVGARRTPVFRSPRLQPGATYTAVFTQPGVYSYYCEVHGIGMNGIVRVVAGGPPTAAVTITDNQFTANDVTVGTMGPMMMGGGMVTWSNLGLSEHTVTERGGDSLPSWCLNGRSFVGNSPTVIAASGQTIRWYVFNLDLSMGWHNFHTHGMRWQLAGETIDVRSIGPAESFVVETRAPPVLLLPPHIAQHQPPHHHRHGARAYHLRGDFLVHCHVEMHMMQGLAGVVRAQQTVWLTDDEKLEIEQATGLPLDPGDNHCGEVDLDHCEKSIGGEWQLVPGVSEVTMMHAVLLPGTDRVLYWGYGPRPDQSRVWDAATGTYFEPSNHPQAVTPDQNIWSSSQAYLDDAAGTILVAGGLINSPDTERRAFLFDPPGLAWSAAADMHEARFYPTTLSQADGRPLTLFGQDEAGGVTSTGIEVFTPGAGGGSWSAANPTPFNYLYYPWTFLLPGGELFVAGPQKPSRRFDAGAAPVVDDPGRMWDQAFSQRGVNMEGTAVLLPLRPPGYAPRILICGGSPPDAQQSSEWIDLSQAAPAWQDAGDLNWPRSRLNSVLLPDGRVLIAGGATDPGPDGLRVEIFDPDDPGAGWIPGPRMQHPRDYHSAALLLRDGSVLMGGDPDFQEHERYFPSYFFRPRPGITAAPGLVAHGAAFTIQTPQAASIAEVVLMRPGAVTHGFNANQRWIGCTFTTGAGQLQATAPADPTVAPNGWYLLFVVDHDRAPSEGRWLRLSP